MAKYPKRQQHFAHRFVRLLGRACVAQEIGPEACYLLTVVAFTEDAKRYNVAPTFYREQLMPILGANNPRTFHRWRERCVEAGWLHYEPPAKGSRRPGLYWVMIPPGYEDLPDGSFDHTELEQPLPEETRQNCHAKCHTNSTTSNASTSSGSGKSTQMNLLGDVNEPAGPEPELMEAIEWWNSMAADKLVSHRVVDPMGKGVQAAWKAFQRDRHRQEWLSDRAAVRSKIEQSPICREGWFRFEKLFSGNNPQSIPIAQLVSEGAYVKSATKPQSIGGDPGKCYPGDSWT